MITDLALSFWIRNHKFDLRIKNYPYQVSYLTPAEMKRHMQIISMLTWSFGLASQWGATSFRHTTDIFFFFSGFVVVKIFRIWDIYWQVSEPDILGFKFSPKHNIIMSKLFNLTESISSLINKIILVQLHRIVRMIKIMHIKLLVQYLLYDKPSVNLSLCYYSCYYLINLSHFLSRKFSTSIFLCSWKPCL